MDIGNAVLVKSFDDARTVIALEPKTGDFEEVPSDQPGLPVTRGVGHVQEGTIGALYADGGALTLQVGVRRWRLGDPQIQLELARSDDQMTNAFRVQVAGRKEAEVLYRSPRADPVNQADPSFDALDDELQDFYLWVTRNAGDPRWIADLSRNWSASSGA
jgi:hypothetical protein